MIVKQKKMDKRLKYKINLDTIYASASSIGLSAIKTIRISGNETKKIFKALTKKRLPKARYCKLINLYDIKNSSVIDKAIVVWFPAPKTYTGENILEINIFVIFFYLTKVYFFQYFLLNFFSLFVKFN